MIIVTCTISLFGLRVTFWRRHGHYWWRAACWSRRRRSIGPYRQRTEAIRDAARLLASVEALRGRREASHAGSR